MAMFVVNLKMAPTEYYRLTWAERGAIIAAWNKSQKR